MSRRERGGGRPFRTPAAFSAQDDWGFENLNRGMVFRIGDPRNVWRVCEFLTPLALVISAGVVK